MRIKFSSAGGQLHNVPCEGSWTIDTLKQKIHSRVPGLPADFELFFAGAKAFHADTLDDLGIKDGDILTDKQESPSVASPAAVPESSSSSSSSTKVDPTSDDDDGNKGAPPTSSASVVAPDALASSSSSSGGGQVLSSLPAREVEEVIVIVFDISGSMKTSFIQLNDAISRSDLSRLASSKICFGAFIDKTIAYEYNHVIGLITFGERLHDVLPITNKLSVFEDVFANVVDTEPATRLFSAIERGIDAIKTYRGTLTYKPKHSRVLCFTDGQDTAGVSLDVVRSLASSSLSSDVVVDGILIGGSDKDHIPLRCLVHYTGGMSVRIPQSESNLSTVFEREPVLALSHRGPRPQQQKTSSSSSSSSSPSSISLEEFQKYGDLTLYPYVSVDMAEVEVSKVPTTKSIKITDARQIDAIVASSAGQGGGAGGGGAALKRIMKEYKDILDNPMPYYEVFVTEGDMLLWTFLLKGPPGTPYEGGLWAIRYQFPSDYPFKPPKVNFQNRIYHCNINEAGGLCLDILKDQWSPALTSSKVMMSIEALLRDPNPMDPLDAWKGMLYRTDKARYNLDAVAYVIKYASLSRDELMAAYNLGV
eukprot:TRINITY_DN2318_c1_g1_i1.p1 TRINITY_DN2318_c1_g1~~TRINITY_DN2318_c1_g1_i1.p1  ORF type:complete len:591 (-),score=151.89 TRINITY_DN2318_c1_g1_i1:28-1800(-)